MCISYAISFYAWKAAGEFVGAHCSWMGGFRQSGFDTHFSKCVALNIAQNAGEGGGFPKC